MENKSSKELIANRYKLNYPLIFGYRAAQTESWVASDTVLSRQLRAIVIDSDHPHRAVAVDGARRSSLFSDPQSVAIISIEDTPARTVIFTEFPLGVRLSDVLTEAEKLKNAQKNTHIDNENLNFGRESLPANFVLAVISQFASVISRARRCGIRCLHLNAENIYLTDSDQIIADGLGITAALDGADLHRSPEELDRSEARGLVVFLAALLLGKNFPDIPQEHDAIIRTAFDMASANNFPQQITDVLNSEINGAGPSSAGDFMRLLAPWDDRAISSFLKVLTDSGASLLPTSSFINDGIAKDILPPAVTFSQTANPVLTNTPSWPSLHNNTDNDFNADSKTEADTSTGSELTERSSDISETKSLSENAPADFTSVSTENSAQASAKPLASAQSSAHSVIQNTSTKSVSKNSGLKLPSVSTVVILLFLLLVSIALVFGFWRIFQPLDETNYNISQPTPTRQEAPQKELSPETAETPTVTPSIKLPAVIENIELVSAQEDLLDPNSPDVAELNEALPYLYDNNPASGWSTWWFARPDVYDQSKLGLVITLRDETEISEVKLQTRSEGGSVQWKPLDPNVTASGAALESAPSLAEAAFSADFSLKASEPVKTKKFLLWINSIPRTGNENRAELVNITLE